MTKINGLIFKLCLMSFILSSCGDMFMKDKKTSNEMNSKQFQRCELDTEAFSFIFEKNIKGDIECLRDTFHFFIKIVKTEKPGYLSQETLTDFIKNGPTEIDPASLDLLDVIFDLSFLLMGGQKGLLSKTQINQLMDLLIYFNERMWKVYRYFSSEDKVNHARHMKERQVVFDELVHAANEIMGLFNQQRSSDRVDRIDIEVFIDKFLKDKPDVLEKVKSLLFFKKIILGGVITEVTHIELRDLILKLPYLGMVVFDVIKMDHFIFSDNQQLMISMFQDDFNILRSTLYYPADSIEPVFSMHDIFNVVKHFAPDLDIDLPKYLKEAEALKKVFLKNGGIHFTNKELVMAFEHVEEVMAKGQMFYRIYDYYRASLDSSHPISREFKDFPIRNSKEELYLNDFSRIARGYHFYRGSSMLPLYTFAYQRNENGFFEIMLFEYLVKEVMATYGDKSNEARGGYHLSWDQMYTVLDTIKVFLRDQGIVTVGKKGGGEVASITDNFVLMSTLFQYQSDGCDGEGICMEVPEATEFLLGIWAAVQVKDFFVDEMSKLCANEMDEYGRFTVDCFRKNFVKMLEIEIPDDGRSLSDYMPLMYRYIKDIVKEAHDVNDPTTSEKYMHFLSETEAFTRTCTFYDEEMTEPVPMRPTDGFAVFAGLLSVEATMIRHDKNQNNILDGTKNYNEVLNAYYEVYEGAIQALVAPNGGFMLKLAKPIFMYIIKTGRVPDTGKFKSIWKFLKFMMKYKKDAPATRTTIATVLKVIGEQNNTNPFKCEECLRNPNIKCEPEDGSWD